MTDHTIGNRLSGLRARSGLSLQQVAIRAGYRNGSSIQRYFSEDYQPAFLPLQVATRLADALAGTGAPAIQESEVLVMAGIAPGADAEEAMLVKRLSEADDFIKVSHTERVKEKDDYNGLERFFLDTGSIALAFEKTHHLNRLMVSAFMVSTSVMAPRYNPGEIVFVSAAATDIGDYVFLIYKDEPHIDGTPVSLGRLIGWDAYAIEVQQYSPAKKVAIARDVLLVAPMRILPAHELLSQRLPFAQEGNQ